jgi:2-oxoglutarate dehydrogenase complex dihydrolipoamide succinyltransferase (E2) component
LVDYEFRLPDIGEGVAEGEILKWLVKEGDIVTEDQSLVEVMTDKVNVQIPSPRAGRISKTLAKQGEVVKVGQTILVIEVAGTQQPQAEAQAHGPVESVPARSSQVQVQAQMPASGQIDRVLASPATRRIARELGVDITQVKGSGPSGRVTDEDVRKVVGTAPTAPSQTAGEERVPLRGVRKTIADRMARSIHTTAQVTHVDEADVTELVLLREAFKGSAQKRGVKLTFLPLIIKAVIPALKEFPYVNSSLDEKTGEIVLKKEYNLGIAIDTEQGLMVPVTKDAGRKDVFELAAEIEKLATKARSGELDLEEVKGSTFTITNIGAIGGLFATPIINYPEVAILGVHKISKRPVVRDSKIEPRDMMYLSLSFDHRVIDGAYAARFMNKIIDTIEDPKKLLSEIL